MKRGKGRTIFPLGHDGVTQRQRCEELSADGTLPAPDLLHQARGRHEQATARVQVPAQVHGLRKEVNAHLDATATSPYGFRNKNCTHAFNDCVSLQ